MAYQRYSDEERAAGLAALEANGGNIRKTARETGIPKSTLIAWRDSTPSPPDEIRTQKRTELKDLIRSELDGIFAEMGVKRESASYKDLATAAGILLDKDALLNGDATSRVDVNLSTLTDDELKRLARG